jgi:hypothetical protein
MDWSGLNLVTNPNMPCKSSIAIGWSPSLVNQVSATDNIQESFPAKWGLVGNVGSVPRLGTNPTKQN